MQCRIVIYNVKPISKQSGTKYGRRHAYLTQEYKNFKEIIAWEAKNQLSKEGWKICTDKEIYISCGLVWPKKTKREDKLGDIADNVISGIYDALQGVVYKNDKQIYSSIVSLYHSQNIKKIEILITTGCKL